MRAETGSSRPSVWDDRPRIDKAGQNRRSDGWKSDVYCQPRQVVYLTTQPKTELKTVTKKDTGKQHENEPDDINADNNEEVQG